MRARQRRLRAILFLGVGLGLTTLGVFAYATDALRDPELDTVDARFSIRGAQRPPDNVVVVKIDDVTFDELGERWPFPRSTHARLIERIAAQDPAVIAYDVQFSEPSDERADLALADAISRAEKRVVLATTEVNDRGEGKFLGAEQAVLSEIGGRLGNGLLPNDPGGVIRRVSFEVGGLESFSVAAVETATGRQVNPGDFDGETWIDYHGPPGTIESVSFSRALRGQTPRGLFRGKLVVVGPSAPSLQDVHPTSASGDDLMAGAEIQANAISTLAREFPLRSQSALLDILLIVVLGLAAPVASLKAPPLRALALALGAGGVFAVLVQVLFNGGRIVSFVYPIATLVLVSVGVLGVHYLTAAFERERVRDLFSRFVPENVVDDVLARADEGLRLGGVQREGTVMFSDLRGFTSFAESMPPDQVIGVLNRYLTEMSDAILDHGGTLVAYMGDGIMAVFGAPLPQDDHADRALAAAREMLGERLERFNSYLRSERLGQGFRMGIGLNSGQVMSGNVGSERRLEYTAIGDTTNTAARLEGMTKGTPHMLFLADSTRSMLKHEPDDLVYVDEFEIRGRIAKIKLWSIPDGREPTAAGPEAASSAS